jgi:hypothetical protein
MKVEEAEPYVWRMLKKLAVTLSLLIAMVLVEWLIRYLHNQFPQE